MLKSPLSNLNISLSKKLLNSVSIPSGKAQSSEAALMPTSVPSPWFLRLRLLIHSEVILLARREASLPGLRRVKLSTANESAEKHTEFWREQVKAIKMRDASH